VFKYDYSDNVLGAPTGYLQYFPQQGLLEDMNELLKEIDVAGFFKQDLFLYLGIEIFVYNAGN